MIPRELKIETASGSISALYLRPRGSLALFVLAHGAGAGMRHPFLEQLSSSLAGHSIATLRFQFPFTEAGRKLPDRAPVLEACVRDAVHHARRLARGLPIIAGGKSMGGRMTSQAHAEEPLRGVRGIAFLGFPLHPAKRPEKAEERSAHLSRAQGPLLFLQGTRDPLAPLDRLRPIVGKLGPRARLDVIDGADHGFSVLVRSGRKPAEVFSELAAALTAWCVAL